MVCPTGGFPTIRHNELRDVTASLLTEVCHNVATEPRLQPRGETLTRRTAISTDDARLDIRARGFWSAAQDAHFDVRVFYPNAPSNSTGTISAAYVKHENIKKRAYGERVKEHRTWCLHTTCFFLHWGNGEREYSLLQKNS